MGDNPITMEAVRAACGVADDWLALKRRVLRVPGVQAAVLFDGQLALDSAHGWAKLDQVELTTRHLFRVASHSKTFTATAILQLVEAGRMRLDDTLGTYLDWVPASLAPVSVRELLAHGGGVFRDGNNADHWVLARPFPDTEALRALLSAEAAVLPPNERFKYSNVGYGLLGQVIEAVTGKPYGQHLQAAVIDRLGLQDTRAELDSDRLGDYATGYSALVHGDRRVAIEHVDTRALAAATGFSSTAADMVHYAAAHRYGDDRLLSDASKRLAQREEWEIEGEGGEHYGLGFQVLRIGPRRFVGHGGGYPGHATKTLLDPESGLAVSVLTNAIDGPAEEMATAVVKLVNLAAESAEQPSDAGLDRFTGAFAQMWGRLDVVRFGSRLLGLHLSQPDPTALALELTPQDDTTLRVTGGGGGFGAYGETLHYRFDESGAATEVRGPGGLTSMPLRKYVESLDAIDVVQAPP